ncbi:MAG: winged helix-turn-helix transcriptional regulator [Crenarchaeota archaeon]|nr:winged helix-turn-helix transcriptional regulator [Thermoproteota archaeon]
MQRQVVIALTLMITPLLLASLASSVSISISRVSFTMNIDPVTDVSYVVETIYLSPPLTGSQMANITVPVIPGKNITIVNVKSNGNNELFYTFDKKKLTLTILAYNASSITIEYVVSGISDEVSIGVYAVTVNLENFTYPSLSGTITIFGKYSVYVAPKPVSIENGTNCVIIRLNQPLMYVITLVSQQIVSPTHTVTTTSIQPSVSPTTSSIHPKTTPATNYTGISPWGIIIGLIIIALAIAVVALYMRRGGGKIEIETMPSGDILSDDTVKHIILLVGDAGDKGIKQSRLVTLTGRPKSTISRRVKRMMEEGYVEIIRAGKYNIIKLTDKGREVYEKLKKEYEEKNKQ